MILHLAQTGNDFFLGRRFLEIVVRGNYEYPSRMSRRDNALYDVIAHESFNVNQIDNAAFGERNVDIGIQLRLCRLFPALFCGTERHEDRRILTYRGTKFPTAINNRIDVIRFVKKVNTPLKHIHWKRLRKLCLFYHSRSVRAA